ncbi:MAG TPA: hypothetical protein VGC38_01475 [Pseudolabrys sp.]
MTPEQVTRLKGWMFAMIGGGIASLYMAYEYTIQPTGIGEPPPAFAPYLFGGIGIVCLIVAAIIARKTARAGVAPATTDLKSPQGKTVIRLMIVGFVALAGSYAFDFFVPKSGTAGLVVDGLLLLVMAVCFVSAGLIARNIRRNVQPTGTVKE